MRAYGGSNPPLPTILKEDESLLFFMQGIGWETLPFNLKFDCEGSEYEILHNTNTEILKNIQALRGEFHENKNLTNKYDIDELYNFVSQYITDIKVVKARGCFIM